MSVNIFDVLGRAATEASQSFLRTQPQIEEQKVRKAQAQLDFMHALAGDDPQTAFSIFGEKYRTLAKDVYGVEIPTREVLIKERRKRKVPAQLPASVTTEQITGTGTETEVPAGLRRFALPESAGLQRPGRGLVPGEVEEEVEQVVGTRRELALPAKPGEFGIRLHTGQTVPVSVLRGLPSDLVMYLVRGDRSVQQGTYGELFGEAIKPEWRGIPAFDEDGKFRFPPSQAFFDVNPQAHARYQQDYQRAYQAARTQGRDEQAAIQAGIQAGYNAAVQIDPKYPAPATLARPGELRQQVEFERQQEALRAWRQTGDWNAASAIDPITFPPRTGYDLDTLRRREQALRIYGDTLTRTGDLQAARDAAAGVDPTFPQVTRTEDPQAATWRKFFAGQQLTPGEEQFIASRVRQGQQNDQLQAAMRIISTIGPRMTVDTKTGRLRATQQEVDLFNQAMLEVSTYFGVPYQEMVQRNLTGWQRVVNWIAGKVGIEPFPAYSFQASSQQAQMWARQQLEVLLSEANRQNVHPLVIYERARSGSKDAARQVPIEFWDALLSLLKKRIGGTAAR